jgi:hypothetical protein
LILMRARRVAARWLWLALLLSVICSLAYAGGQWFEPKGGPLPFVDAGPGISENAAAAAAARATGGRVLSVRRDSGNAGQPGYTVKVLMPDGRVRNVRVDGASGAVR